MKVAAFKPALLAVSVLLIILASFSGTVAADANHKIEHLSHSVSVMYNGYILVNDTIKLLDTGIDSFFIGFPYKYGPYIVQCTAYNVLNSSDVFPVTLNVPLDNRAGFYGAKINFPKVTPQMFTVCFVLSSDLLIQDKANTGVYTLDFPAYPSLTMTVDMCNVSIVLPEDAVFKSGTIDKLTFGRENLQPFTYAPANVVFSLTGDAIQKFDVKEFKREIKINELGEIQGSDFYRILNKARKEMSFIEVILPPNASNPTVYDSFGRPFKDKPTPMEKISHYKISFPLTLETNKSATFTIKYDLPKTYIIQKETDIFYVSLPLFQNLNYYVEQASVTFALPEGSRIKNFEALTIEGAYSISRSVFEESLTINKEGISSLDSFKVGMLYQYSPLWLSFRPTLWIWALTVIGCIVAVAWKRPKAPTIHIAPTVAAELHPGDIKSFLDAYEDKTKIILELKSLETRVQKGRIPRRRYKVQKKALETRLNTLSKNIAELKMKIRAVGGQYADLMRQLEVAEAEINEVDLNIRSIEARHKRGELSLEAYRKLQADYQQRKEKAETTINGILLRLREEIR